MPCYQVNLISVEFKAKNVDLLKKAAGSLGWTANENGGIIDIFNAGIQINLNTGKAIAQYQDDINALKRAYSEQALVEATRKKKWYLKKLKNNQYVAKKY